MNTTRKLSVGNQVRLHYRLSCNGEEIVNTFADEPETFRLGQGDIDPRLEALLIGLQTGDHRTYELDPGAAFGSHEAGMIHTLPRSDFAAGVDPLPGHDIEFTLPNGQTLHGIVRSVTADTVEVDFNHPLAGLPVVFEVEILDITIDNLAD
jgi:FKBP-type peptidyl-prolyl cis-trans isomerase SlpA